MLKEKYADEIAAILARYPTKNSAVIPLSYLAQDEYGHLTSTTCARWPISLRCRTPMCMKW